MRYLVLIALLVAAAVLFVALARIERKRLDGLTSRHLDRTRSRLGTYGVVRRQTRVERHSPNGRTH